jgi:MtN3 and saliva related transmembrane protein
VLSAADLVGTGAALCSMTSFAPQIAKIVRDRDASSVSLKMYAVTVTGFALWILYGSMIGSWPIVTANLVCLVMSATILVLKWRLGDRPADRTD